METCLNCGAELTGKYCSKCGQEKITERFNTRHLLKEATHDFFHWESSILQTFKQLIKRPGYFINEYIAGKRKHFVKPFSYFIFIQAIFVFIFHILSVNYFEYMNASINTPSGQLSKTQEIQHLINTNVNYLNFLLPLLLALCVIVFLKKKKGVNYAESFVFSLYTSGTTQVLGIFCMLLSLIDIRLWNLRLILNFIYLPFAVYQFSGYSKGKGIIMGAVITAVTYFIFIILITFATFGYLYYVAKVDFSK